MSAKPSAKPSASVSNGSKFAAPFELFYIAGMIKVDASKAQTAFRNLQIQLGGNEYRQAAARSLYHTMQVGKSDINKAIRALYKISSAEVSDRLFVQNASTSSLQSTLWASIAPLPMSMFSPVEVAGNVVTKWKGSRKAGGFTSKQQKKPGTAGVSVEIMKGNRKTLRSAFLSIKTAKGAVRAFGKYGGDGFSFSNDQAGPISTLKSLSIFWAIQHDKVAEDVTPRLGQLYVARYEHELTRILNRLK